MTEFDPIKAHMIHHEYNIFGISETWLDNLDHSKDLMVPGYVAPKRRDNNGHQGVVLVYMSVNALAQHRQDLESPNSEIIVVELQLKNTKVLICNCYRPPHKDIIDFTTDIEHIVDTALPEFQSIIFLGDMNGRNKEFWVDDRTTIEERALTSMLYFF